jgi:geranylgeranyl diphosphate synthase type II
MAAPAGSIGNAFAASLSSYREMILKSLLASLPTREPRRYLYHPLEAHLSRMGKGLRPSLCLATCRAFGGTEEQARQSAIALEMLHNAFLVHDDVEDGSAWRHGQPTMHAEHGIPIAVNVGDAMTALGLRLLRENLPSLGIQLTWRIFEEVEHMMLEALEGQAMELGWVRDNRPDVTEEDYLLMILKKTCWYSFISPCRIGALIATRDTTDLERFNHFGYYMGTAFQIQDDVLNLIGDFEKYGKEIGGDLWEGKRTLMLVHLLRHCSETERARLHRFLGQGRLARLGDEVDWALDRMHHYASIDYAVSVSQHFAGATLYAFFEAYRDAPDSEAKAFIEQIIHYMVNREL